MSLQRDVASILVSKNEKGTEQQRTRKVSFQKKQVILCGIAGCREKYIPECYEKT